MGSRSLKIARICLVVSSLDMGMGMGRRSCCTQNWDIEILAILLKAHSFRIIEYLSVI
jgi:hypothetical protein